MVVANIANAQKEAQTWLEKLRLIKEVNENIAILLKSREIGNRISKPPDFAPYLEDRIKNSIESCNSCLKEMLKKLQTDKKGLRAILTGHLKAYVNISFIKSQERITDMHLNYVSLSLTLLHCVDQAVTNERIRSTQESVKAMHRLLETMTSLQTRTQVQSEAISGTNEPEIEISSGEIEGDDTIETEAGPSMVPDRLDPDQLEIPSTEEERAALLKPAVKTIMIAVQMGNVEAVTSLLHVSEDSQSLYAVDVENWNVLHHAARIKSPEILRLLLEAGLKNEQRYLDMMTRQAETPLMVAAKHAGSAGPEAFEMVEMLVSSRCNVNAKNEADQTALYFAIEDLPFPESEKIADMLVENGADIEIVKQRMPEQVRKYRLSDKKPLNGEQQTQSIVV